MGRGIGLVAVLVLVCGCGGSEKEKGFLDRATLEQSIGSQVQTALHDPDEAGEREAFGIPYGTDVSRVICVRSAESERKFDCNISLSSGDSEQLKVIVSEDGETWVPAAD